MKEAKGDFYYPDIVLDHLVVAPVDENEGKDLPKEAALRKLRILRSGNWEESENYPENNANSQNELLGFLTKQ